MKAKNEFYLEKKRIFELLTECLEMNNARTQESLEVLQGMFALKMHEMGHSFQEYCKILDQLKESMFPCWNDWDEVIQT